MYSGLSADGVICSGNSLSNKNLYLLYDTGHYNLITKLKAAMAKRYICNACDTLFEFTHKYDSLLPMFSDYPVLKIGQIIVLHATGGFSVRNVFRIIWLKVKGKLVCQWRQICRNCSFTVIVIENTNAS